MPFVKLRQLFSSGFAVVVVHHGQSVVLSVGVVLQGVEGLPVVLGLAVVVVHHGQSVVLSVGVVLQGVEGLPVVLGLAVVVHHGQSVVPVQLLQVIAKKAMANVKFSFCMLLTLTADYVYTVQYCVWKMMLYSLWF